jgi:phosphoribosylaminoimidazole-succinocarboxamide synthase
MGSVKDLTVLEASKADDTGLGRFFFSDRYSVFDWGKMPDLIPNKGAALCMIAAYCFEQAEKTGIPTHYFGIKDDLKSKSKNTVDSTKPAHLMEVELVRVIRPTFELGKYDYSKFTSNLTNYLLPLELIYRNRLLPDSSLFNRLKHGDVTFQQLGLNHYPLPGETLNPALLDVSTKLESKDRYLSWEEAQSISGLTENELVEVKKILLKVDDLITEVAEKAGLTNEDGKIEIAFSPYRRLMIVDVFGTPDECRFKYEDVPVSKELARQFYRKTEWYEAVQQATKSAKEKGITNWKELCTLQPPLLPPALKEIISEMYMSTANAFLEKRLFNSPSLTEVVEKYRLCAKNGGFLT